MQSPKWVMQGVLSNGEVITQEALDTQIADLLGSYKLTGNVMATNMPTKPETEMIGITAVTKKADWN